VISCANCRVISARRHKTVHFTVVSTVLCTGYVMNKTVSCVLMNVILVTMIHYATPERGIMGFTAPKGQGIAARGSERSGGPRAAILRPEGVVKLMCPNEGVA
jgi:hypothetical protein